MVVILGDQLMVLPRGRNSVVVGCLDLSDHFGRYLAFINGVPELTSGLYSKLHVTIHSVTVQVQKKLLYNKVTACHYNTH